MQQKNNAKNIDFSGTVSDLESVSNVAISSPPLMGLTLTPSMDAMVDNL